MKTYLSLFAGIGGADLASKDWRCLGYVENEDYCQRLLAQRIKDGHLHNAPIFGDIKAFVNQGYAASYKGLVDAIVAGFPCQPFSHAGTRQDAKDDRNLWPQTLQCVRICRPLELYLENVPMLIICGYFHVILCDLAQVGYNVEWQVVQASQAGARHKRARLWIKALAYANGQ